jgi:hypothetical protein
MINPNEAQFDEFVPTYEHEIALGDMMASTSDGPKPRAEDPVEIIGRGDFAQLEALIVQDPDQAKLIQDLVRGGFLRR